MKATHQQKDLLPEGSLYFGFTVSGDSPSWQGIHSSKRWRQWVTLNPHKKIESPFSCPPPGHSRFTISPAASYPQESLFPVHYHLPRTLPLGTKLGRPKFFPTTAPFGPSLRLISILLRHVHLQTLYQRQHLAKTKSGHQQLKNEHIYNKDGTRQLHQQTYKMPDA